MHVHVVDHPLAGVRLTTLRNETTDRPAFRRAVTELSRMIVYEALRDAPTVEIDIDTPLEPARGVALLESPVVVPVMRAGLGMLDATLELLPDARVGFVGLKRDEETLLPDAYVNENNPHTRLIDMAILGYHARPDTRQSPQIASETYTYPAQ